MLLWHRILHQKGWIAPLWPKEHGGPGWSITQRFIFEQETSRAGALPPLAFSVTMVGPVIYTFGNAAQKQKFLPRILYGEDWWCQGYSEPGSGSDLASVRTKAVRNGDTTSSTARRLGDSGPACRLDILPRAHRSHGQAAGRHLLPADRHEIDGHHRRPIITIDGSHDVNDVFLENVRVPVENRIGEENKGGRTRNSCSATSGPACRDRPVDALPRAPQGHRENRSR